MDRIRVFPCGAPVLVAVLLFAPWAASAWQYTHEGVRASAVTTDPYAVELADLNSNGNLDFVVTSNATGVLVVGFGNGDGTFALPVRHTAGGGPRGLALAELNGDDMPDVVVANEGSSDVSVFLNQSPAPSPVPGIGFHGVLGTALLVVAGAVRWATHRPLVGGARSRATAGAIFALAISIAPSVRAEFIANGLAPPTPENVITGTIAALSVRNVGCKRHAPFNSPCEIPRAPTTVEIVQGALIYKSPLLTAVVDVADSSVLRVSGGQIGSSPFLRPGRVFALDQSHVHMTGGRILGTLRLFERSSAHIEGGVITGIFDANEQALVHFTGGSIDSAMIGKDGSTIFFAGGAVSGRLESSGDALTVVTGGEVATQSRVVTAFSNSVIEIVGSDFAIDGVPAPYGPISATEGDLTGTLYSGDAIDVRFRHSGSDAQGVPLEQGTIVLSGAPTPLPDTDGDGVPDRLDLCIDIPDPEQFDRDVNGVGDACNDFEDEDGDEYADDRDTCPDVANAMQVDTDDNGLGDACNDGFDADGDEFEDAIDVCPDVYDAEQRDRDGDGLGDACDLFPDDPFNLEAQTELKAVREELALARFQRDMALGDLEECRLDPPFLDADGDGVHDRNDRCAESAPGANTDGEGCSLEQFCTAIEVRGVDWFGGSAECNSADWMNDEPAGAPGDCRVRAGSCTSIQ